MDDYAVVCAFSLVHQFTRIGRHSYIGANTVITQDVMPFSMVVAPRGTRCYGINSVAAWSVAGYSPERIKQIEQAFRFLLRSKLNTAQAIEKMRGTLAPLRGRLTTDPVYRIGKRARLDEITQQMAATAENAPGNWGLIAGNGDFPFLVLEGARSRGIEMAVIAIREEASPALARVAPRLHWVSLGELSRAIELLHEEGEKHAVMAGQVKHNKNFQFHPAQDWRLAKLLFVAAVKKYGLADWSRSACALQDEGIELVDSHVKFLGSVFMRPKACSRCAPVTPPKLPSIALRAHCGAEANSRGWTWDKRL